MEDVITIREILEFAIAREVEAVHFYTAMARKAAGSPVAEFFEDLASEELEHKSRLELEVMKEGIVARTVGVVPEISEDQIAVHPAHAAEKKAYADALNMGIEKERRSFRLYARLAGLIEEEESRKTLMSLAEEEVRHLVALEQQYNNAMKEQ